MSAKSKKNALHAECPLELLERFNKAVGIDHDYERTMSSVLRSLVKEYCRCIEVCDGDLPEIKLVCILPKKLKELEDKEKQLKGTS